MAVVLIGYRGCGKSTVGALVAERLQWRFVDADLEIERRAGRSIGEIFAVDGEPAFRRIERNVMADLLDQPEIVVAAGGGAILDAETREQMKRSGPIFYLSIDPATAAERITADAVNRERRPALTTLPHLQEIETVMNARLPLYAAAATVTLDAASRPPESLAESITAFLTQSLSQDRRGDHS